MDLLRDIKAGHGQSALKQKTDPPRRAEIRFTVGGRRRVADLWTPAARTSARAGVVLVPGVAPEGRDDRRLTAFAASLARARFRVLVPEIPNLRALRVAAGDATIIADAVAHLSSAGPEAEPEARPVALIAISYAVGPAILALRQDRARRGVGLLLAIGGYRDLANVISYFTTGHYRGAGGRLARGRPDPRAKWAFVEANAIRAGARSDVGLLELIAKRRIRDPRARQAKLRRRLTDGGKAILMLAENTDPARVPDLIAALPADLRGELRALDLAAVDLSRMRAEAVFLHGQEDPVIPAAESRALAAAWAPGRARLVLLEGVRHVDAGGLNLRDSLRLMDEAARILKLRDAWHGGADGRPGAGRRE